MTEAQLQADRYLMEPAVRCSWSKALAMFRYCEIQCVVDYRPHLQEIPDLPNRIRGALGRALEASKHDDSALVWHLMFGPPAQLKGEDYARGYVVRSDIQHPNVVATVRLFGIMQNFADLIAQALQTALQNGIALDDQSRHRIRLECKKVECIYFPDPLFLGQPGNTPAPTGTAGTALLDTHENLESRARQFDLFIKFLTPLNIRKQNQTSLAAGGLAQNIFNRFRSLTRWSGCNIAIRFDARQFAGEIKAQDLQFSRWLHTSARHSRSGIDMEGLMGEVRLCQCNLAMLHLLRLGEIIHAGGGGARGLGRMLIVPSPTMA